ncbi:MAG: hypothetical protein LCH44_08205 [Bacteroidetes bacterium]|jgi:hypothetical protein|nr:hypothetical protein [Bacteroidota bacterium]MCA9761350.1 hypothetical protein [Streptococcus sp.]
METIFKILEALGLATLVKNNPRTSKVLIFIVLLLAAVLFGYPIFKHFYIENIKKPDYLHSIVTLKLFGDTLTPHFSSGRLALMGVDQDSSIFISNISQNGKVHFDSLLTEWRFKRASFAMDNDVYRLKANSTIPPSLDYEILLYIEKIPSNFTAQPDTRSKPPQDVKKEINCPNTIPYGKGKPSQVRVGYKWISGYYKKVNGSCMWINGFWTKITIADCPKNPPSGYSDTHGVVPRGFRWLPGQWRLVNGECKWISGSFQKIQAQSQRLPDGTMRPAPTFVPPPRSVN